MTNDYIVRGDVSLLAKKPNRKNRPSSGSGQGFGTPKKKEIKVTKTYGSYTNSVVISDSIVSTDEPLMTMEEFFNFDRHEAWHPLFRSIASSSSVPAMEVLKGDHGEGIEFDDNLYPWRQLSPKPEGDENLAHLATFLDAMQKALTEIPIEGYKLQDAHDLHFIEEGRRMLLCKRFHVLPGLDGQTTEGTELLFQTCWSEIARCHSFDSDNIGSLILLPDYDLDNLKKFTQEKILRPLNWLGALGQFEVVSLQREISAIRIIYKIGEIPDLNDREQQ